MAPFEFHFLAALHLLLATPCVFLGMYFYRKQTKELDVRKRIVQRLWIAWSVIIFVVVGLSLDHLWSTWVNGT